MFGMTEEDRVDVIMSFAEAVPWGKRWAARVPNVIGYCIAEDATAALAELRECVREDLVNVSVKLMRREIAEMLERDAEA